MPIYTPRGLRLRLKKHYAFALMARLHGKVSAFSILQLTEAVDNLGGLVITIAAALAAHYQIAPWEMVGLCAAVSLSMTIVHIFGLFIPPITLLLPLSRAYSIVSGYGIILLGLCAFLYFSGGLWLVLAMLGGRLGGWMIGGILNIFHMKLAHKHTGFAFTASERSFFHAYRLAANKHGVTLSLSTTDEELSPENWMPTFTKLAFEWPTVVERFTDD